MSKKVIAERGRVAARKSKSSAETRESTKSIKVRGAKGKEISKTAVAKLKKKLAPTQLLKGKDPAKVLVPKVAANRKPTAQQLSDAVNIYEEARRKRLEIQNEAKELADLEGRFREFLIDNVSKGDTAGVTGATHRVSVKVKSVPRIEDEAKLTKFAKLKGNEDLLKLTINNAAIEERWEAGKKVPGVTTFEVVSLSLNKL